MTNSIDCEQYQVSPPSLRWDVTILFIVLHLGALLAFLPSNFSIPALGVAVFLHWLTIGLGISLGFHRLASHRSFKVPKLLEYFFILCGTLAFQGGVTGWVGYHRMHHYYSDRHDDPHDASKGFWWSHVSWLMHTVPNKPQLPRFTQDIAEDPFYKFCRKHYITLQIVLGVILYALGGMSFVVWGIFVRLFVGLHSIFFVNSACHAFGYRNFNTSDRSTNCWWVALLTFGEWHNNHHACQSSARLQWRWWELDPLWFAIRLLEKLGLATDVKTNFNC